MDVVKGIWQNAWTRIAADGAANVLFKAAQQDPAFDCLDAIIGDLDSITDEVRQYYQQNAYGTQVVYEPNQYSTDFSKAVCYVYDLPADSTEPVDMIVIGGLGGRADQAMSQLHHLCLYQGDPTYSEGRMFLFSGDSLTFVLNQGHHKIQVREEDGDDVFDKYVGIIPINGAAIITTKGLEWDVTDWETEFGQRLSTSNHVLPETKVVEVQTDKTVLFTIATKAIVR
jgi:thiamine pyrophosphokinase